MTLQFIITFLQRQKEYLTNFNDMFKKKMYSLL